MDFQECVKFASEIHVGFLSTLDGDQPRVRPLGLWYADETGFYFQTESVKAFYKQMRNNSKVEVCFFAPENTMKVLRITGEVEFIDDIEIRTRCFQERPIVKSVGIETPDDPLLVVFRIARGEAYFWTMADNMKESEIERIKFGSKQ